MGLTTTEYIDDTNLRESMARRLIAKDLKIVTGTLVWSASSMPGSAGETLAYKTYGDRFLWMGMTPRLGATAAANAKAGFVPMYDPSTAAGGTIYFAGSPGASGADGVKGEELPIITKAKFPTSGTYTVQFCLMVVDNLAGSGLG